MKNAIKATLIIAALWALTVWFHRPTFKERFQPAIDRPLKAVGFARQGFCFPDGRCVVV